MKPTADRRASTRAGVRDRSGALAAGRAARFLARAALTAAALTAAGCADPLVGARCASGYVERDGRCVLGPPLADAAGDASRDGGPDLPDGRVDSGPDMDGGTRDGAPGDGGVRDGSPADGGAMPCDLGELECAGVCVRPASDPMNCGDCGVACAASEVCASGACRARCDAPLVRCGPLCIDVMGSDPDNCGACGRRCPSGLCSAGVCVDATAGHVVLVGHDYRTSRAGMNQVAGNAVFLAPGAPVRVIVYEGSARPASMRGVDRAVDQVATSRGRTWTRTPEPADKVLVELATADVLLVYAQTGSDDATVVGLGALWGRGLMTFLRRGGTIVVFDAPGVGAGTYQLLSSAGVLMTTGQTEITGDTVMVSAPGDAVALGVPLSYRAEMASVRFDSVEPGVVVRHVDGPVVIHRVVIP